MSSNLETIPGFCPLCGDCLPLLKDKGTITCWTCGTQHGANVYKDINADFEMHFNKVDDLEIATKHKKGAAETEASTDDNKGPIIERKCGKCGNEQMSYATLQLRSADEGQTVFYTCTKCGNKETENS